MRLLILFLIAFAVMLFPIRTGFHNWDETAYLQHAEIFAGLRKDNFNELNFRPIFTSLLMAGGFKLSHSLVTAHIIISFLAALGAIYTYLLAKEMFDEKAATLSALIFIFIPIQLYFSHTLLVDQLLPSFWAASVYYAYISVRRRNYAILAGVFIGISFLTKFTSILLIFMVPLCLALSRLKFKDAVKRLGIIYTAAFLTVLPYLIFLQLRFGNPFESMLHSFAVVNLSSKTSFLYFYTHFFELFPFIFFIGILILAYSSIRNKSFNRKYALLFLLAGVVLLLSQRLEHKEMRYLMGMLPFLSILSAEGFNIVIKRYHKLAVISAIAVSYILIISLPSFLEYRDNISFSLVDSSETHPVMEAALWLEKNTPKDTKVYANDYWPVIAYYSKRPLIYLAPGQIDPKDVREPGYIVIPTSRNASLKKYFEPNASFGTGGKKVYLYKKNLAKEPTNLGR